MKSFSIKQATFVVLAVAGEDVVDGIPKLIVPNSATICRIQFSQYSPQVVVLVLIVEVIVLVDVVAVVAVVVVPVEVVFEVDVVVVVVVEVVVIDAVVVVVMVVIH